MMEETAQIQINKKMIEVLDKNIDEIKSDMKLQREETKELRGMVGDVYSKFEGLEKLQQSTNSEVMELSKMLRESEEKRTERIINLKNNTEKIESLEKDLTNKVAKDQKIIIGILLLVFIAAVKSMLPF